MKSVLLVLVSCSLLALGQTDSTKAGPAWTSATGMINGSGPSAEWPGKPADPISQASFVVGNPTTKPLIAWGLRVTSVFKDGSTMTEVFPMDRLTAQPLASGEKVMQPVTPPSKPNQKPVAVRAETEFTIGADNSVTGNESQAAMVFAHWQSALERYDAYQPKIETLESSADLSSDIQRLRASLDSRDAFDQQFSKELRDLSRCAAHNRQNAPACVADYLKAVRSAHDVYAAHIAASGSTDFSSR